MNQLSTPLYNDILSMLEQAPLIRSEESMLNFLKDPQLQAVRDEIEGSPLRTNAERAKDLLAALVTHSNDTTVKANDKPVILLLRKINTAYPQFAHKQGLTSLIQRTRHEVNEWKDAQSPKESEQKSFWAEAAMAVLGIAVAFGASALMKPEGLQNPIIVLVVFVIVVGMLLLNVYLKVSQQKSSPWLFGFSLLLAIGLTGLVNFKPAAFPDTARYCPRSPDDAPDYILTDEVVLSEAHNSSRLTFEPALSLDENFQCAGEPAEIRTWGGRLQAAVKVTKLRPARLYWMFGPGHDAAFTVAVDGQQAARYVDGRPAGANVPVSTAYTACRLSEGIAVDSEATSDEELLVVIEDLPSNRPPAETDFTAAYLCVYSQDE